ncbi:MAG: hypothetical protein ABW221_27020 [Vicinamibacteria bacterium]
MRPPRLSIDAAAGATRLAGGALQGPWQVPAELARRALRAGARRVDVRCRERSFSVADDGPPLDAATAAALTRALDPRVPAPERDAALAALEAGPHAELRYLAALPDARIAPGTDARGVTVAVDGVAWDAEESRGWLRSVGRFAGGRLVLDGAALADERPSYVAQAPLLPPRAGRLWLPMQGEDGALWLTEDGIVSAFLVAPSAIPFVAQLDLSGCARVSGDGALLREVVAGDVAGLVEQAARLALRAATEPPDGLRLRRLRQLLLAAARLPRFRSEALHARTYLARTGAGARWLSLVELAAPEVQGADRRVPTCPPEAVATSLFLSPRPALVLDASERARLSQELGLRFRLLSRAERALGRSWRGAASAALARLRARLAPARPLSGAHLAPGERALLAAMGDGRAAFAAGGGPVRWHRGRLLLPRGNADVGAAVRAVGRGPGQAFAAVLALSGSVGPDQLRAGWRERARPVDSSDQGRTG